uniref:DNA-directed RNA polymerase subunit beta' n=1 Tax=Ourococcus multisporus TaxID=132186 RepID=A0A140GIX9_9CHLO|nr:beta subunit of RNA polymerase [Ourococcus multisporus]
MKKPNELLPIFEKLKVFSDPFENNQNFSDSQYLKVKSLSNDFKTTTNGIPDNELNSNFLNKKSNFNSEINNQKGLRGLGALALLGPSEGASEGVKGLGVRGLADEVRSRSSPQPLTPSGTRGEPTYGPSSAEGARPSAPTPTQLNGYSKIQELKLVKVGLASSKKIVEWAEKVLPNGKIFGEVLNANTLHYKTFKPHKGGLFCERIFGPLKDFECACGYKQKPFEDDGYVQNLLNTNQSKRKFCPNCDVEYTWSVIRRYQLGYIKLASPVSHLWYLRANPSYLSLLLDIRKKDLESIIYCMQITTLEYYWRPVHSLQMNLTPAGLLNLYQKSLQLTSKTLDSQKNLLKMKLKKKQKNELKKRKKMQILQKQNAFIPTTFETIRSLENESLEAKIQYLEKSFQLSSDTFYPSLQNKTSEIKNFLEQKVSKNVKKKAFLTIYTDVTKQFYEKIYFSLVRQIFVCLKETKKTSGFSSSVKTKKSLSMLGLIFKNYLRTNFKKSAMILLKNTKSKQEAAEKFLIFFENELTFWYKNSYYYRNNFTQIKNPLASQEKNRSEYNQSTIYLTSAKQPFKKTNFLKNFLNLVRKIELNQMWEPIYRNKKNKISVIYNFSVNYVLKKVSINKNPLSITQTLQNTFFLYLLFIIQENNDLFLKKPSTFLLKETLLVDLVNVKSFQQRNWLNLDQNLKQRLNFLNETKDLNFFSRFLKTFENEVASAYLEPLALSEFRSLGPKAPVGDWSPKLVSEAHQTEDLQIKFLQTDFVFYENQTPCRFFEVEKVFQDSTNNFIQYLNILLNKITNVFFKISYSENLKKYFTKNKKEFKIFLVKQQLKFPLTVPTTDHEENDKSWRGAEYKLAQRALAPKAQGPLAPAKPKYPPGDFRSPTGTQSVPGELAKEVKPAHPQPIPNELRDELTYGPSGPKAHALSTDYASGPPTGPFHTDLEPSIANYNNFYFSKKNMNFKSFQIKQNLKLNELRFKKLSKDKKVHQFLKFKPNYFSDYDLYLKNISTLTKKLSVLKNKKTNASLHLFNNIYTVAYSNGWQTEKDWRYFLYYNTSPIEMQDRRISFYKHRFIPESLLEYSFATTIPIIGANLVQKLLFQYEGIQLKKMAKQLQNLLPKLTRYIRYLKQKAEKKSDFLQIQKLLQKRDQIIRRLKLLRKLFKKNVKPRATLLNTLPVLPPDLRPILKMQNQIAASDLNRFYQRILYRNERLKKFLRANASMVNYEPGFELKYAQRLLQEAVDNLIQNGKGQVKPETNSRGQPLKSLSEILKGKQGRFRQYLLGKRVDYSGRSVIVVGPNLKIYQCGLPFEMAIELFLPFLIKKIFQYKLARTVIGAKTILKTQKKVTWDLLEEIMQSHPILLNRAPTLHRLGIQAFQPKLIEGRAILLHPLVCPAFNADFDGDQMAVHVPITVEARTEAWKLMFSRNHLMSSATGEPMLLPSQDMVLGCYYLTTESLQTTRFNNGRPFFLGTRFYFSNMQQILAAYQRQKIHLQTPIWMKWNGFIETEHYLSQPLEIRLDLEGFWTEFRPKTQKRINSKGICETFFVRTTAGRILFNTIIQNCVQNG